MPRHGAAALGLLVCLAASCGAPREPFDESQRPTTESPSRAAFEFAGDLVAGSSLSADNPLTLVVTLGRQLSAGAQVAVAFPTAVQEESEVLWSIPTVEPGVPGSILIGGTASDRVEVLFAGRSPSGAGRVVLGLNRLVEAGETIRLGLTGQVPQIVPKRPFRIVEIDESGTIAGLSPANVALPPVQPAPAVYVLATLPADMVAGESAPLRLAALDPFGNVDERFRGRLTLAGDLAGIPAEVTFGDVDAGLRVVDGVRAAGTGTRRVTGTAELAAGPAEVASNPVRVWASRPKVRRYFGDPHAHSGSDVASLSSQGGDHRGHFVTAEDALAFMRDVAGLDWGATAEHDTGLTSQTWLENQRRVDALNQAGGFATLLGYEWTPPRRLGHHVVLHDGGPSDRAPLVGAASGRRGGQGAANFMELGHALRLGAWTGHKMLMVPHVMQPFPNADPERQDASEPHEIWDGPAGTTPGPNYLSDLRHVGEIYSHHNDDFSADGYRQTSRGRGDAVDQPQMFEVGVEHPWTFQHAWATGHRIGVIAGSDNHLGTPGLNDYAPTVPHHAGLAVVLAPELTREAVFEALAQRRCYATSGARILLDATVAGRGMGEEFYLPYGGPVQVAVEVAGTAPLASVEIVKLVDGKFVTVREAPLDGRATDATLAFSERLETPTIYYIRVRQVDGEMAWSSPFWVNVTA
jgi:hypothetical protein